MLNDTAFFTIHPDSVCTIIDNESVLMPPTEEILYGANPIATNIWQKLTQKPMNINMLSEEILNEYDVSEAQCRADLHSLIQAGLDGNLLLMCEN